MVLKFFVFLILLSVPLYFVLFYKGKSLVAQPDAVPGQNLLTSANAKPKFELVPPSIDRIFNEDHTWTDTLPSDKKRVLIATGDVLLARSVNSKTVQSNNFTWPFEKTADILKTTDITFVNLETPLLEKCPLTNEGMIFCGDPRNIEGLLLAGVDVVNIANNHSGNYGIEGINDTITFLSGAGLIPTGISGPVYKDVNGVKFAFLGYNEVNRQAGISSANQDKIAIEVSEAKSNADIVIVQFHWGNEYTTNITSNQRALGHLAIDSGADLIIWQSSALYTACRALRGEIDYLCPWKFYF